MIKSKAVYQRGFAPKDKLINDYRLKKSIEVISRLKTPSTPKILDAGCGDGYFTLKLGQLLSSKRLYGFEISSIATALANKNGIKTYCLDIDDKPLPFKSDYFDIVFCGSLIEIVNDPDNLLSECHRVLKKKGVLIITFPNIAAWASRLALLFGYLPYYSRVSTKYDLGKFMGKTSRGDSNGFIRLYSLSSFKKFVSLYGFRIISVHGAKANGFPKPLTIIDSYISKIPSLAFQVICVLKKN
jgi:SAM-dependent methyltransferase